MQLKIYKVLILYGCALYVRVDNVILNDDDATVWHIIVMENKYTILFKIFGHNRHTVQHIEVWCKL